MQLRLTKAVKAIMIACFAMFVVQHTADQFFGANVLGWLALVPSAFVLDHRFWQVVTYAFLHADVMHLFLNLMMLLFIGSELEALWGTVRFLRFYFFCSISAGFIYLLLQLIIGGETLHVPMVGASGAIYGLLVAYGILFAERTLLFMMLFPMRAKHFVWILAAIEFMSTVFSSRTGVAGVAHLGGMGAGFLYLWGNAAFRAWKKRRDQAPPKKRRPSKHLKLVVNRGKDGPSGSGGPGADDDEPKTWH